MKKIYALMFALVFSSAILFSQEVYVVEEEVIETAPEEVKEKEDEKEDEGHPLSIPFTYRDYSHWSLSLDLGLNYFQGDMNNAWNEMFKSPLDHWSLGANVEYTINPMLSVGASYMFSRMGAHDNQAEYKGEKVDHGQFTSDVHQVAAMLGFNLLNIPLFNRNKNWDFWIHAGAGAAHYNSELYYHPYTPIAKYPYITEEVWHDPDLRLGYSKEAKWIPVVPLSFEVSYSITKQFIIGLKYRLNLYLWDAVEGGDKLDEDEDPYGRKNFAFSGSNNDVLSNFLLSLRWDITPKDKVHMRKITWKEYKPKTPKDPRIDDLARRLDSLENLAANVDTMPVPVMIPVVGAECKCDKEPLAVYFDFDRYDLDREALIVIRQIARILRANPDYTVEVRGYTDIKGSNPYNGKLSQRRADVIKDELVKIWGIDAERIIANGDGKATDPAPDLERYHPINRRCDFFFIEGNEQDNNSTEE